MGPTKYGIEWSDEAKTDLRQIPVFRRALVFTAIEQLRSQAEIETRNRKALTGPIEGLPDATWEVRVGEYRGLYWIEERRIVRVLRVILKAGRTTAQAVARGRRP